MELSAIIAAWVTLFVVIDPPGLAPLFIALTQGMTEMAPPPYRLARDDHRGDPADTVRASIGENILSAIGISLSAFRIAGGILLFLTALDMLFERRTERREGQHPDDEHDPSVFPLATPLLAGPVR